MTACMNSLIKAIDLYFFFGKTDFQLTFSCNVFPPFVMSHWTSNELHEVERESIEKLNILLYRRKQGTFQWRLLFVLASTVDFIQPACILDQDLILRILQNWTKRMNTYKLEMMLRKKIMCTAPFAFLQSHNQAFFLSSKQNF